MTVVLRNKLKLIETPDAGTGDDLLTRDTSSGLTGSVGPIDTSTFLGNTLAPGYLYIGNVSSIATAVPVTGEVTITSLGVTSIAPDVITNEKVNSAAGIVYSKLNLVDSIVDTDIASNANISKTKIANGNINRILINDASGVFSDNPAINPDFVLVSNSAGLPTHSTVSVTTLSYVDATSSIQTQLNNRLQFSSGISPAEGDILYYSAGSWVNLAVGDNGEVLTLDNGVPIWQLGIAGSVAPGGTTGQFLTKVDSSPYSTQWSTLTTSLITDITASSAELNLLDGVTTTTTQFNYSNTLTSNIQSQLDNKLNKGLSYNALFVGDAGNNAIALPAGSNGQILTIAAGVPVWQTPTPPGNVSSATAPSVDNELTRYNGTIGDSIQGGTGITISDAGAMTFPNAGAIQTGTTAANTLLLRAYDVDGASYTTFATLTANNTPTFNLEDTVTKGGGYIYRAGGTDVAVADGGTNISSYTAGDIIYATGATTLTTLPVSTNGFVLTLSAGLPVWAAAPGGGASTFITLLDAPASYAGQANKSVVVNAGETAVEFQDRVQTISGVTNRTTITGTALLPIVDISASYVGQATITTLGVVTTGTWNATRLSEIYGGTNQNTYTTGDILYSTASNTLGKLAIGTSGTALTVSGGVPAWTDSFWKLNSGAVLTANNTISGAFDVRISTTSLTLEDDNLRINNPANTFYYQFTAGAIAASRVITLPTLTGDRTMMTIVPGTNSNRIPYGSAVAGDFNNNGSFIFNNVTSVFGTPLAVVGGTTLTAGSVLADFQSTTLGVLVPRVTTIASVATPVNGMVAYDATTNLWNFRQNGSWVNLVSTSGDVVGPGSATDNAIARFDLTTGKLIQNSTVTVSDAGSITIPNGQGLFSTTTSITFDTDRVVVGGTSYLDLYGNTAYLTAPFIRLDQTSSSTNTVLNARISHSTSATPAIGIGAGIVFEVETSSGNNESGASIEAITTDVTSGSEDFDLVFKTMSNGAASIEQMRLSGNVLTIGTTRIFSINKTFDDLFIGNQAGNLTTTGTGANVGVGTLSLPALTNGVGNVAVGYNSGNDITSGSSNVLVGTNTGSVLTTSSQNVIIGNDAGDQVTSSNNTLIGADAGALITSGGNNIVIGQGADVLTATSSNQLSIQNIIYGINNSQTGTNPSTGSIGIGIQSPTTKLDVDGPVKVKSYTVAGVPSAAGIAGAIIFVSNESGGAVLAFSDDTNWRRVTDRAVIS